MKGAIALTALLLVLLLVAGCAVQGQDLINSPAPNYIRVTEYHAGYPMLGGVQGCQVSGDGQISAGIVLRTENCVVEVLP